MCVYMYVQIYVYICAFLQGAETKYEIIFKTYFSFISLIFEKNLINLNFPD